MADSQAIVTGFLDALDRRDGAALGALLAGEAVHDDGTGGRVIGAGRVRDALIERATALDETHADRVVMTDHSGRRAAAEVTLRGSYRRSIDGLPEATGQSYSLAAGLFFEIDDGRIVRFSRYLDAAALVKALSRT